MGINKRQKKEAEKKFLEEIGIALGDARRQRRLTQKAVAAKIGCSLSHLNDIENGNANTTAYEVAALCNLYHISPMQIFHFSAFEYKRPFKESKLLQDDEKQLLETLYQKFVSHNMEKQRSHFENES